MREPRPGEDWTLARCANTRRARGPCCFCGKTILPAHGFVAYLGAERAHNDCSPALGVPVR